MRITLPFAFAALAFAAAPAAAQQNCAPRQVVIDHLTGKFGESRQAIGLAEQGRVIEVFASEETGTWTIVVTLPNGVTCLVAAGEAFELLAEEPAPQGTPS